MDPSPTSVVPTIVNSEADAAAKTAKMKQKNFLLWLVAGITGLLFTMVIALVIIGSNLIISSSKNINLVSPAAEPVKETPVVIPAKQSKFATDSAVINLRDNLTKLRKDIDSADLIEPQLAPPSLDLEIKIPPAD